MATTLHEEFEAFLEECTHSGPPRNKYERHFTGDAVIEITSDDEHPNPVHEWLNAREIDLAELSKVCHELQILTVKTCMVNGDIDAIGTTLGFNMFRFAYELAAKRYGATRPA